MTAMSTSSQASASPDAKAWIKSIDDLDDRWVTVVVVTVSGEDATYVIPKRTGFPDLDRQLSASR